MISWWANMNYPNLCRSPVRHEVSPVVCCPYHAVRVVLLWVSTSMKNLSIVATGMLCSLRVTQFCGQGGCQKPLLRHSPQDWWISPQPSSLPWSGQCTPWRRPTGSQCLHRQPRALRRLDSSSKKRRCPWWWWQQSLLVQYFESLGSMWHYSTLCWSHQCRRLGSTTLGVWCARTPTSSSWASRWRRLVRYWAPS